MHCYHNQIKFSNIDKSYGESTWGAVELPGSNQPQHSLLLAKDFSLLDEPMLSIT